MNTCRCTGSVGLTDSPSVELSVGTSRQPSSAEPFARDHLGIDVADDLPPVGIARHEQIADRVFARLRQLEAELGGLLGEKLVRDLHQDAGAVAHARVGADRAAMLQIAQDAQPVLDDLVRLAALDVGDEADAAGILVERGIVQALRRRRAGIGGRRRATARRRGTRRDPAFDNPALRLSSLISSCLAGGRGLRRTRLVRRPDRRRGQRATDLEKGSLARPSPPWLLPLGATDCQPRLQRPAPWPPAIRTAILS